MSASDLDRVEAALTAIMGLAGTELWHELAGVAQDWRRVVDTFGASHPFSTLCLLALVRLAWVTPGYTQRRVFVVPTDGGGYVVRMHTTVMDGFETIRPLRVNEPRGDTEAEACLAALEAAPEGGE